MRGVSKGCSPHRPGLISMTCLVLLVLLMLPHSASARPRTAGEAAAAVRTWLEQRLVDGRQDVMIRQVEPWPDADEPTSYIVHLVGGGYCLAGADDLSVPVLFYGIKGEYDPTNPGLQFFLIETRDSLNDLKTAKAALDPRLDPLGEKLAQRAALWDDLVAGRKPSVPERKTDKSIPDYVVLPLTSEWHQTGVFNGQCPVLDGPPNDMLPSKVGCVALAAAQIMYYWQWPDQGAGSRQVLWPNHLWDPPRDIDFPYDPGIDPVKWAGRLTWSATPEPHITLSGLWDSSMYSEARADHEDEGFRAVLEHAFENYPSVVFRMVEADFGSATYDWDLIQDVHLLTDGVDAGDEEVAKLCFHAGVMSDMNWGVYKSLAWTGDVSQHMPPHFKYDVHSSYSSRDTEVMIDEIAWYRPLLIRGEKPTGAGHAWVVFGYDLTGAYDVFMMNLGWGGSSIGWYAIDDVQIDHYLDQMHIKWMAPDDVVRFVEYSIIGGDGSPNSPYWDLETALDSAPDGVTLVMRAGEEFVLPAEYAVIDRPRILKGTSVVITRD